MAVNKVAGVCPCCGSTDSHLVDSNFVSGKYSDRMACEDCDAEWNEIFEISSFEIAKKEAGIAAK